MGSVSTLAAAKEVAGKQEFESPGMSWADTLGNIRVLDKWRADAGLEYNIEKPARKTLTIKGEKLAPNKAPQIPRRQIKGLNQPTSLVSMGFEFHPNFAAASVLLDAFYERGGNLFDTAWVYAAGKGEMQFGDWHTSRAATPGSSPRGGRQGSSAGRR